MHMPVMTLSERWQWSRPEHMGDRNCTVKVLDQVRVAVKRTVWYIHKQRLQSCNASCVPSAHKCTGHKIMSTDPLL